MSFYYAEPADYIKINEADKVAECFEEAGMKAALQLTWNWRAFSMTEKPVYEPSSLIY